ncbi:hypothetical protein U9M48_006712 [Paspalum notatum var. saurae]|uniref:Uncharacterized protein n=1 Tax=Paspalum notatum var. saurae TaxID=547442 RepID=A0AAQ3SGF2_PASNO
MEVPAADGAAGGGDIQRALVRKSAWTKEEDAVLREQVRLHGPQNWASISEALPGRNHKSCRLRWCQHLNPSVDATRPFTPQEDERILRLYRQYPSKWATIADFLPGRTDNAVKNRWHSVLSKRYQQELMAASPSDGTTPLFPVAPGGTRAPRPVITDDEDDEELQDDQQPVGDKEVPPVDEGFDLSGDSLKLFPLAPGDLVEAVGMMDADCSADEDESVLELRLGLPIRANSMAAFKAMVQAVRAP